MASGWLFGAGVGRAGRRRLLRPRRAIGSALRPDVGTDPDAVRRFVDDRRMLISALSVRAPSKHP
jgi:hypothetical protein